MKQIPGGIYIASKAVPHGKRWRDLRDNHGVPFISSWIDLGGREDITSWPDLWATCLKEVQQAKALIVYAEPGEILKGAWIEVGAALAAGVPVIGVGIEDHTIAESGMIKIASSIDEAILIFKKEI